MKRDATLSPDVFDTLYAENADPWRFRTSDYERGKYDATLVALSRPHYRRALEIGCSIGVFTARLAGRCDAVLAIDASRVAIEAARQTCANLGHVTFETRMVPQDFPIGQFDLIILSEVLYYLDRADLERVAEHCAASLAPQGEIILCHWLGDTDYPLTGREANDLFVAAMAATLPVHAVLNTEIYRLDRLSRA